ncbi:MAG: hypothetical protein ABIK09_02725 [Pseudomonadota bacterium]
MRDLIITLSLFTFLGSPWAAAEPGTDSVTGPAEKALLADMADGSLDDMNLVEAGLVASGVVWTEDLGRFRPRVEGLVDAARAAAGEGANRDRARRVFEWLHQEILVRYEVHGVDLPGVLNDGRYNCVSATLLYNGLLEELGIRSAAVLVPSHVYSVVRAGDRWIEVETTSPKGFSPARTLDEYKRFLEARNLGGEAVRHQGGDAVENTALIKEIEGERERVDNRVLVALVYSNIGVARLRDRDPEGALAAFSKATAVGGGIRRFRESRDGMINNLAWSLLKERRYDAAIELMDRARTIGDLTRKLRDSMDEWAIYAFHKKGMALVEAERFTDARDALLEGLGRHPGQGVLLNNLEVCYTRHVSRLLDSGRIPEGLTVAREGLEAFEPVPETVGHNYAVAVQRSVQRIQVEEGRVAEGLALAHRARDVGLRRALAAVALDLLRFQVAIATFRTKDWAAAATLFRDGFVDGATGDRWRQNYVSALVNLSGQGIGDGTDAGLALLVEGTALLEGDGEVLAALWRVVLNAAKRLGRQGKAAQGVRLIEDTMGIGLPRDDRELLRGIYVTWTAEAARAGDRVRCLKAAEEGMGAFPGDDAIRNNYEYCLD